MKESLQYTHSVVQKLEKETVVPTQYQKLEKLVPLK